MKKIVSLTMILLIILALLSGCSSSDQTTSQTDNPKTAAADVKDKDALYLFVNDNIFSLERENFDKWDARYFDITGDGSDEAVLICNFGEPYYEKMEIVSGDTGELARIPSDIPLAKYNNSPDFVDGILSVAQETGGTGEQFLCLNLYAYNGTGMTPVLQNLNITHTVSAPGADYVESGEINGSLRDFEYSLIYHDNNTGEENIAEHQQYIYNEKTMSFEIKQIETAAAAGTSSAGGNIDVKSLKPRSSYAGGTIKSIVFHSDAAQADLDLTLNGEFTLTGILSYNEYYESITFKPDQMLSSQGIELGGNFGAINPFEWPMGFRNEDVLASQLGSAIYEQLKGDPNSRIDATLAVKDYSFMCQVPGEAGGGWELTEVVEIGSY